MQLGELDVDASGLKSTLGSINTGVSGTMASFGKLGSALSGVGVIIDGIGKAFGLVKETLDLGGTLSDLSASTRESVGDLVILRSAFDGAGLGADKTGDFLLKLQDSIAGVNEDGKSTAGALDKLGLSAAQLRNLPAIGQVEALQKGFAGLTEQTERVAIARDLFGKSGGEMLALLGDATALDTARQKAGPLADIMEKNAAVFDNMGDVIGGLKLDFQEFFAGALSMIAPEATSIGDALSSIDWVGIGELVGGLTKITLKLGEAFMKIAPAINWVSEKLSKLLGSGSEASAGLAEKYRGFAKLDRPTDASGGKVPDSQVSALQRIGGGGGFGGGADPLLSEAQRQTSVLERIERKLPGSPGGSAVPADVPV